MAKKFLLIGELLMLLDSQVYTILMVALIASTLAIRLGLTLYE